MNSETRQALLRKQGMVSAECLLCGQADPPGDDFSFDEFWVRDQRDWAAYQGGPVHRVCAANQ